VLLNFGEPGGIDIAPWAHRVRSIDAKYAGAWELELFDAYGVAPDPARIDYYRLLWDADDISSH